MQLDSGYVGDVSCEPVGVSAVRCSSAGSHIWSERLST